MIATLLPEVKPYARALITQAAAVGIAIKAISGLRTYDEQNDLYAQGRTKPGKIVTNAKGGYSSCVRGRIRAKAPTPKNEVKDRAVSRVL